MEKAIECMHEFLGKDHLGRDYVFTNDELELYKLALTHSSNNNPPHHNQRLALIGDSVLRLIIREYLYERHPDWSKGRLTIEAGTDKTSGIERDETYADIAIELNLIEYMDIQNRTFELDSITPNAEVFEALFGAVYLKRGIKVARRVALKHVFKIDLPFDSVE